MLWKQPEMFWAKPAGLEFAEPTSHWEKVLWKSPCHPPWSYKVYREQRTCVQWLWGSEMSQREADWAGEELSPSSGFWISKEKAIKHKHGAALVGLVEAKRGHLHWGTDAQQRSVQVPADLHKSQPVGYRRLNWHNQEGRAPQTGGEDGSPGQWDGGAWLFQVPSSTEAEVPLQRYL